LLKRGYDVYATLVDDQGIDCVIRLSSKRYLGIQIKARSKNVRRGDEALFAALKFEPRDNYYFIFYSEALDLFWVVPSVELVKIAHKNKKGKNIGKYSIWFNRMRKGNPYPKEKYKKMKIILIY